MRDLILQLLVLEHHCHLYKTGIYKIINKRTNKFYIGSASREGNKKPCDNGFYARFYEHLCRLKKNKHNSIYLQRSWNKYNIQDWKIEILEVCDKQDCVIKEQYYLNNLLFAEEFIKSKGKDRRFLNLGYNVSPSSIRPVRNRKNYKKVYQYDLEGNLIRGWESLTKAAEFYDDVCSNIIRSCKKGTTCKGYRWKYEKERKLKFSDKNPIYLFYETGEFYKYFSSYEEVIHYFKTQFDITLQKQVIRKSIRGLVNIYRGFIWKNSNTITVKDVEKNAIVFKNKKFVGVYSTLKTLRKLNLIPHCNWNMGYTNHYGYIKTKSGYEVFKRCSVEIYTDIEKYYELLPNITKSARLS